MWLPRRTVLHCKAESLETDVLCQTALKGCVSDERKKVRGGQH